MKRLGLLLVLASLAAPAAQPMRVAVLPLRDPGLGAEAVGELEHTITEAIASLPGFSVANLSSSGRLTAPKGVGGDQPAARAQQLAKEVSANRALVVEVARLGDGQVVYVQALDAKSGESVGSTTASLGSARPLPPDDRAALHGAVVSVLDPDRFVGRLSLKLDVKGAEVQMDGRPLVADLSKPIEVPVGTHALRVTHPAYHDFLRFIDVRYDQTFSLEVPLAAYPLTEGEMAERQRRSPPPVARAKVPWYRSWWALSLAGVVLTGVTVGIIIGSQPDPIHADRSLNYQFKPTP
jgi:hypothetical protein